MDNRDLQATWAYHDVTKHSHKSVRSGRQELDWGNQPRPFKIYSTLEPIPLPRDALAEHSTIPTLQAIAAPELRAGRPAAPDLKALTRILYYSGGITRRIAYPGGEMLFRAAACTGALNHIELYLICGDLPGLPAGGRPAPSAPWSCRPPAESRRSRLRRPSSPAAAPSGGMPGSTGPAPTGTASGTTGRSWPTCSRGRPPTGSPRG